MREAKKILDKHIQNFYKKNPMARFDDIPNNVFLEAMIEYGNLVKNSSIPDVVGQSEQLVLFADWLQYNGKWSTTEQQVKDFLKEQQEQN